MSYINRILSTEFKLALAQFPVVTIFGPRQAGKTTFVRQECPNFAYVNLEDPEQRALAALDPKAFLKNAGRPLIIDEVQRLPELLSYIQVLVDEENQNGSFVLTGSHQLHLGQTVSQSLAGRTAVLCLLPLSMEELGATIETDSRGTIIHRGCMPRIYDQNQSPGRVYSSYFQTYVERDLRTQLLVKDLSKFEAFMRILAGRTAQIITASSLAGEIGVSYKTVQEWISILEAAYIIKLLHPFYENYGKRFIKSPKLYFVEPGLAAYLLGIEEPAQVERDPLFGNLFENLVIIEAIKARTHRGKEPSLYFLRDSNGMEIDLVFDRRPTPLPIEIKASTTFHPDFQKTLQRFDALCGTPSGGYVIYGGDQSLQGESVRYIGYKKTYSLLS